MLHGITWDKIDAVWRKCAPLIEKALDESQHDFSVEDIYKALKSRDMQLWIWSDDNRITSALVTRIVRHPNRFVCLMMLLGGEGMDQWKEDARDEFYAWARSNNCDEVEIYGRRAWGRALGDGWKEIHTHFRRKL